MLRHVGLGVLALLLSAGVADAQTALQAAATILWDDQPPTNETEQYSVRRQQACDRSDNTGCYTDSQYYRLDNCNYRLVFTRHYDQPRTGHLFANSQTVFTVNFFKVKSVIRSHLFEGDDQYTLNGAEGMVCVEDIIRGTSCSATFPEMGKRDTDTESRTDRALAAFKEMQERFCN